MVTKYKEEKVIEEKISFTDWVLQLPLRVFFWGSMAIMFVCWIVTMAVLLLYLKFTMH
jgi:hypothetical protein